ncbi:MAG: hypothetical protein AB8G23_23745 [Myxococcota bacterium]
MSLPRKQEEGASKGPREALTRVLAIEGRNALARVELAASELSRFEATPAVRARIETIRSAADEIEGLFAKIDLLSTPRSNQHWPALGVEGAFRSVERRIASTLSARNATLVWRNHEDAQAARLEIPGPTLERLLVALIRLGLNLSRGAGEFILDAVPSEELVSITLHLPGDSQRRVSNSAARDARVDLDVQLAEWGGLCVLNDDPKGTRLVLSLPVEALHAS